MSFSIEGEAEWNFQKVSAQKAVENLDGVCSITNNIRVKNKVMAEDVKQKIALAFLRHASIDSNRIKVDVIRDTVILSGAVRSFAEKRDAERTVWSSPGVINIENRLEIDPEIVIY